MAHESSNPKVRFMFVVALITGVTLVLFEMAFHSYYNSMMEDEEAEKVLARSPTELIELRKVEQQRLTSASLPIDRAMKELATRGRDNASLKDVAKVDISPQSSNDQGALVGWGLAPKPVPPAPPAPAPEPAAADGGTLAADGGAALAAGDASALATDAGVRPAADAAAPREAGAH